MMRGVLRSLLCVGGLVFLCAADWLQFRGSDTSSVAGESQAPPSWAADSAEVKHNIAWRADLPSRGVSGPVVVDGRVIVTSASGVRSDRLHVFALDVATGKQLWHRQFFATGHTACHPTSSVAAPTPASDGKTVFAFFSSNDLVALDLDGNLKWLRGLSHDYPEAANDVGMASSPVVLGDTVVVQVENKGDSFAAGLDTATGETRWRLPRLREMNWASPAVLRGKTRDDDVLLLQSTNRLSAHQPKSGEQIWSLEKPCDSISSVVGVENLIYVPSNGLTALRHQPNVGASEIVWQNAALAPSSASPVVDAGRLYFLSGGVLNCSDALTGDLLWKVRVKGSFWATPVIVGRHIYLVNDQGLAQIVRLGDKNSASAAGEVVAEHDFGEGVLGTCAVADGAIYVRGDAHVWKITD